MTKCFVCSCPDEFKGSDDKGEGKSYQIKLIISVLEENVCNQYEFGVEAGGCTISTEFYNKQIWQIQIHKDKFCLLNKLTIS